MDIVSDSEHFYLKYLKLEIDPTNQDKLHYEIRQVSHQWRSRIKFSYSKIVDVGRDWDSCKLKTLSQFMKLYPQWLIYSNFFLIAHRGYISVQDLNREDYDLNVEHSKKSKKRKKRQTVCCRSRRRDSDVSKKKRQAFNNLSTRLTQYIEGKEDKWLDHTRVNLDDDLSLNHIRDMFLEKRDP